MHVLLRDADYISYKAWIFRRLLIVAAIIAVAGPILDIVIWAFNGDPHPFRATSAANLAIIAILVLLWHIHKRWLLLAEITFLLMIIAAIALVTFLYGGTRGPIPLLFVLPILATGLILHPRMTFGGALLVILVYLGMSIAEQMGWIHPLPVTSNQPDLILHVLYLITFASQGFLGWMLAWRLLQALEQARQRAHELQRHQLLLEAQVAERTAALARTAAEAERRANQLALLNSTIRQMVGKLELERLLSETVELICDRFRYSNVEILLIENLPEPTLVLYASHGVLNRKCQVGVYRQRVGEGIPGYVAQTGVAYLAADVFEDPFSQPRSRQMFIKGSELAVPIKQGETVLGVLNVQGERPGSLTVEDQSTLDALAGQLAVAIEQARLYKAEQRARRWAERLYKTGLILASSLDLKAILPRLLDELRHMLAAERLGIYLAGQEELWLAASIDELKDEIPLPERLLISEFPVLEDLRRWRAPIYINRISTAGGAETLMRGLTGGSSSVGAPLVHEDRLVGLLVISYRQAGGFDLALLELIGTVAHQAAQAIVNAQLYQERAEALADLQRAQEELIRAERMRGLGELASGVAHDFNNLLACILGNAELLLLDELDEERRQLLEVVVRAARDGSGTVQRLREFVRARRTESRQFISLPVIVQEALALTRPRWWNVTNDQQPAIELLFDFQPVDEIQANPAELREVLVNLILNAIDAMPYGGTLMLKTWQEDEIACCSVSDTGVGIEPELREKIFEPFFTTKGASGTGLGLAVSAELIRHHGGTIGVESEPGKGTTFTIRLPVALTSVRPLVTPSPVSEAEAERGERLHVLVVDDEPDVCESLARMVRFLGHHVSTAYSGEQALYRLNTDRYDVIFTDLGMPVIGGWDVLRVAMSYNPAPLTVLVTGWGGQISEEEARASGAAYLLLKPFDLAQIRRIVGRAAPQESADRSRSGPGSEATVAE